MSEAIIHLDSLEELAILECFDVVDSDAGPIMFRYFIKGSGYSFINREREGVIREFRIPYKKAKLVDGKLSALEFLNRRYEKGADSEYVQNSLMLKDAGR